MAEGNRLRISIVGVVVISLFCALFARLWYLQATAGDELVAVAQANQVRYVEEQALRGDIRDRHGRVLATNRVVDAVTIERGLDDETTEEVVTRLSWVLALEREEIQERIEDPRISPYTSVVVATDVPIETITYLQEHRDAFPGVEATRLPVREYPHGPLMAHVLGYTGEINDEELAEHADRGYQLGDTIGKVGVEESYELDLRGESRRTRIEVDSVGRPVGTEVEREATPGYDVVLTLDLDVQMVAEEALAEGIEAARGRTDVAGGGGTFNAPAGSVVVLDARDGSVVAMSSYPTYDPREFTSGIPSGIWEELNDPANDFPLINRAIQGAYAPGSTFKLIAAIAGLESGTISPYTTINDTGSLRVGDRQFRNSGGVAHGAVDLPRALTVSSNVFFYNIAASLYQRGFEPATVTYSQGLGGEAIQDTARKYGMGALSGIELPSEVPGRVPDAEWKAAVHEERPDAFPDPFWYPGDAVNTGVGQGDMLTTPLQLAEAYAAFANGEMLYKPRMVAEVVEDPGDGEPARVVRAEEPVVKGTTDLAPEHHEAIMTGLVGATQSSGGTAAAAFGGFPHSTHPVAGKTGTGEVLGKQHTSLFAAIMPADDPRYVVVAVIEEAGFGGSVAAPIVRSILDHLVGEEPSEVDLVQGRPD